MVGESSVVVEDDSLVILSFYGFPASLLKEFGKKIVKPYFQSDMAEAIKCLMEKSIIEEALVKKVTKQVSSCESKPSEKSQ